MAEQLNIQAMEALALANQVRRERAIDKKRIHRGDLSAVTVLRCPHMPGHWVRATVMDLLMAIRGVGETKALRWLSVERISSGRQLGDLTGAQRERLAQSVEVWSR